MIAGKDELTGIWSIQGLELWRTTFVNMIDNLKMNKAFKFSRFGDGEWNCIFGKQGQNCDGHQYFTDMGESLRRVLLSEPNYILGMQPLTLTTARAEQVKEFIQGLKINWVNADVLHNASIAGILNQFIRALDGRYIILVGPAHLSEFFPNCVHIVIPDKDCWLQYENIRQQIEFHVDGVNNAVVLFAASMMTNVLVDDFADHHHTFIDIGSVLDPYVGVKSRRYHYKLKI